MSYASYKELGKDPNAPPKESIVEITLVKSQAHRESLIKSHRLLVIDNYTDWCGPCKKIAPHYAALAKKYQTLYPKQVLFVKENAEHAHPGAQQVRGVPCFHFYLEGRFLPDLTLTGGDLSKVEENLLKIFGQK